MSLENEMTSSQETLDVPNPQENGVSHEPPVQETDSPAEQPSDQVTNGSVVEEEPTEPVEVAELIQQLQKQQQGTNESAQAALQRTMELLKDSEVSGSVEEMRKLDSQIDHFNSYLDKFEAKNNELNKKLNNLLETQKEERSKRVASFQQREAENREQAQELEERMQALLDRCHAARVTPVSHNQY